MSQLNTTTIRTKDGATDLTVATGNTSGPQIVVQAAGGNVAITNATSLTVGANAGINTTAHFIGNSSVNAVVNSSALVFNGSSGALQNAATAAISKGFTIVPNNIGTQSSGTLTPDPTLGNYQYYSGNGAHTLAAPSSDCAIDLLLTNGSSAGAITFSGFTVGSSTGSALTTTNTNKFIISIRRVNSISTYSIYALQ